MSVLHNSVSKGGLTATTMAVEPTKVAYRKTGRRHQGSRMFEPRANAGKAQIAPVPPIVIRV
jgi:hypothetical protein